MNADVLPAGIGPAVAGVGRGREEQGGEGEETGDQCGAHGLEGMTVQQGEVPRLEPRDQVLW